MGKCYRCGWCGSPTSEDGTPLYLEQISAWESADWDRADQVNGDCCPHGDSSNMQERMRDERDAEMRRDAFGEV
jgi:hypothetical protein